MKFPKPKTVKQSTRRRVKIKGYSEAREARLKDHFWCERCHENIAAECHHIKGRNGSDLADPENLRALCRECHRFIHANPLLAREQGWMESRL